MVQTNTLLSRTTAIVTAAALVTTALIPALFMGRASAGLPTARKITMSTSQGGATDVNYTVQFTTDQGGGSSNINGVVIEFCDSSPIIGDSSCTAPTGFDTNFATLDLGSLVGLSSLTVDTTNSTATRVILTGTNTAVASATAVTIPLGAGALSASNYLTNPTAGNHTFYARVLTYATAAAAQGYTSADPAVVAAPVDAGGVALSTANQLQITSKVQERLTFCLYTGGACSADTAGAARTSAISLGNTNGVLDPTGPFVDVSAKFDISTNAVSGATVVLKGNTLTTGAFNVAAIGGTKASSNPGNEQFGMCIYQSAGAGLTLANTTYNDSNCNSATQTAGTGATGGEGTAQFGFNTANTTSVSGETIATKAAGSSSTATMPFIGNIAYTTEAGIYTTTLTYIATGQY